MAFRHPARLGAGALQIPAAGELSVAHRHLGLLALIGVPGRLLRIQGLRIQGVQHHQDPHLLSVAHKMPQCRQADARAHRRGAEPPQGHAVGQQHDHKDQGIHQGNAQVFGKNEHRQGGDAHVGHQLDNGPEAVFPVPQQVHVAGHGIDEDDLAHLAGLDVQAAGQGDPAAVAAHALSQKP